MDSFFEMEQWRKEYGSGFSRAVAVLFFNSFAYISGTRIVRGPLYVGFDITYRCQARCKYCNRWKLGLEGRKEISTSVALQMIRELGKMGVWVLSIGGGEPLLRKDIFLLVKEAKRCGMMVNLCTNGLLVKNLARRIIDSGVDSISISIEGCNPRQHDSIRRLKGLFAVAEEGIRQLKSMRSGTKPLIKVRFDVSNENYLILEDYVEYWEHKVDKIILQPIHEDVMNAFVVPDSMKFSDASEKKFRELFGRLRKKYKWVSNSYYNEFGDFFFSRGKLARKYSCFAGYFSLHINPDMNVFPCTAFMHNLGSLRNSSITQIWNGEKMVKFRKMVRGRKNKCFCWYNCNGMLNCYLSKTLGLFRGKQ